MSLNVPIEAFPAGTVGTVVSARYADVVLIEVSDERGVLVGELFTARTDQLTVVS